MAEELRYAQKRFCFTSFLSMDKLPKNGLIGKLKLRARNFRLDNGTYENH